MSVREVLEKSQKEAMCLLANALNQGTSVEDAFLKTVDLFDAAITEALAQMEEMERDHEARHPGLFHCPLGEAELMMPELREAWESMPIDPEEGYTVDVKVHMLMPGQWPCIPNWHCDFVPRDHALTLRPDQIDSTKKMFLWLDGPPFTEFQDGREVRAREWVSFTQEDEHRGVASTEHCWRTFIRLTPCALLEPAPQDKWLRRHSQVYLDARNFTW